MCLRGCLPCCHDVCGYSGASAAPGEGQLRLRSAEKLVLCSVDHQQAPSGIGSRFWGIQWTTTAILMVRITDKPMEFLVYRQMNGALGQVIIWNLFGPTKFVVFLCFLF